MSHDLHEISGPTLFTTLLSATSYRYADKTTRNSRMTTAKEQETDSLSPTVEALTKLLRQEPKEFDIAILRAPAISDDDGEAGGISDPFILSECGVHLGLNAGDLAWVARDFRRAYREVRPAFLIHIEAAAATTAGADSQLARKRLLQVTSCLLLVCPDNATAWADRKRALLAQQASTRKTGNDSLIGYSWDKELRFLNLLMTKHTKAPTSWFHRKYVFQKIIKRHKEVEEELLALTRSEIKLCISVADRYPKNYYAWTHRIYVLHRLQDFLENTNVQSTTRTNQLFVSLLEEEWASIQVWLRTHVSDHSAAHFGGVVLRLILQNKLKHANNDASHSTDDALTFVLNAITSARKTAEAYPTHEVLWIFRRICSHAFLTHASALATKDKQPTEKAMAEFWSQEITDWMNNHGEELIVQHQYIENDEVRLEAAQSEIFKLSYVVWVLECVVKIGRQGTDGTVQCCVGTYAQEAYSIRSKALYSLKKLKCVPHNVYRSRQ